MKLFDQWNENKFSIYKNEEKTVLKLIESFMKTWFEPTLTKIDDIDELTTKNDLEKVSKEEIASNYKLSPIGNFTGTWNGLDMVATETGMASEIVNARGTFPSLMARMNNAELLINHMMVEIPLGSNVDTIRTMMGTYKKVLFLDGDYVLDKPLAIPSNVEIKLSPLTKFKVIPGGFTGITDSAICLYNAQNVRFYGTLSITMNKAEYITGEWKHCLDLKSCKNIAFDDVELYDSGGDGISIGSYDSSRIPCENVRFKNILVDNCKRNGVSFMNCKNIWIKDMLIKNINGTNPQAAIDFEPNINTEMLYNIFIDNITTLDCVGSGVDFAIGNLINTTNVIKIFIGKIVSDGRVRFVCNVATAFTQKMKGIIKINDIDIAECDTEAIRIQDYNVNCVDIIVNNLNVNDCRLITSANSYENAVIVSYSNSDTVHTNIGSITFQNIKIELTGASKCSYLAYFGSSANVVTYNKIKLLNIDTSSNLHLILVQFNGIAKFVDTKTVEGVTGSVANYSGKVIVNTTGSSYQCTLPVASSCKGLQYKFMPLNAGIVIKTNGENIIGATERAYTAQIVTRRKGNLITLESDGTNWVVVQKNYTAVDFLASENEQLARQISTTAIPSSATGYVNGDISWNSNPTVGQPIGWVMASGSWRALANLT